MKSSELELSSKTASAKSIIDAYIKRVIMVWLSEDFRPPWEKLGEFKQFEVAYVKKTIDLCKQNGVTLHIYTSPVYKKHLDLYKQLGLYQSFNTWKSSLAYMTDYTDFALCNAITRDKNNFRDSSHIIGKFGYKIAQMIYDKNLSRTETEFGLKVTSENIEEHLKHYTKECNK